MSTPAGEVLQSTYAVAAPAARARAEHHLARVEALHRALARVATPAPAALARQHARGKLAVRERIEALLDPLTPFLEVGALAAIGQYDDAVPAAGLVAGIGRVRGRECMVVANDSLAKGGAYFPMTVKKHLRAQEIARENRLPCLYLVDSGGAFLPLQAEIFADRDHFGRIFTQQAQMSAAGIPQVAVVLGMCTAGGAYVPAMADETIIVAGQGTIYLAGPPLVRAATGEDVDAEALGGGAMHARQSGVVDHLVADEAAALRRCRDVVAHLGPARRPDWLPSPPVPPRYPPDELLALLPTDPKEPLDVREILARLLDDSRLHPFKADYGVELLCGFAHWLGHPVGVVANSGPLFGAGAQKGAHFVQLCAKRRVPIVFLHDIAGFMVGQRVEQAGIVKDGAKMVQAVATCGVPCISLVVGASSGAGNYAMCGRALSPRFMFTWPNARVSVMGGRQAADVLLELKLGRGDHDAAARAAIEGPVLAQFARESDPYFATSRLWDDGIIDPRTTREVVGLALSACLGAPIRGGRPPVFRF